MKHPLILTSLAALALVSAGCGNSGGDATGAQGGSMASGGMSAVENTLGTPQMAGPYSVTLTSEPTPPTTGSVTWKATVTENGKPVKDATVNLALSMPSMSMEGATAALAPSGEAYSGAAEIGMPADYKADVTVNGSGGKTGTASFTFNVPQSR